MRYVIYNKETTYILRARARSVGCYVEYYKSESAAKAALTRLAKAGKLGEEYSNDPFTGERVVHLNTREDFAIAEAGEFRDKIEKIVKRRTIFGVEYEEAINTPACCSPSTETYWCM